jgi:guanylate kinase
MSNRGKLIVISAPSGSGKTTLINMLIRDHAGFEFSISATTRPPRGLEKNGVEYYFLSRDEFDKRIANNEFVEYKTVYGNMYGTLKKFTDDCLNGGKNVIFDVDVQGGIAIKDMYPDDVVMIFIYPPSIEELRKRLESRGTDSQETIEKRLNFAKIEMEKMKEYSYNVCNDSVGKAYSELLGILHAEGVIKEKLK